MFKKGYFYPKDTKLFNNQILNANFLYFTAEQAAQKDTVRDLPCTKPFTAEQAAQKNSNGINKRQRNFTAEQAAQKDIELPKDEPEVFTAEQAAQKLSTVKRN